MADKSEPKQNEDTVQPVAPGTVVAPGSPSAEPGIAETPEQESQAEIPPKPEQPEEPSQTGGISWKASEFVAHDKSSGWYMMLSLAAVAGAIGVYFLTRDYVSAGVVIFAAIVLGVFASHKPRQLDYLIDEHGIKVDQKVYSYQQFRTFSIIPEGAFSSIMFMPLKRFAAPLSIYYAPEDEDKIVDLLSSYLPFEERRRDAVDHLMHKIRF